MRDSRYSGDIFSGHARSKRPSYPEMPAEPGIIVEIVGNDFVGAVVGFERTYDGDFVRLEDRYGTQRLFKMLPGAFMVEGQRVTLTRYVAPRVDGPKRSNSGSGSGSGSSNQRQCTPAPAYSGTRMWCMPAPRTTSAPACVSASIAGEPARSRGAWPGPQRTSLTAGPGVDRSAAERTS